MNNTMHAQATHIASPGQSCEASGLPGPWSQLICDAVCEHVSMILLKAPTQATSQLYSTFH